MTAVLLVVAKAPVAGFAKTRLAPAVGARHAARLANAHADVAAHFPGSPVLQVGMDTPQLRPSLLTGALTQLAEADAVLGPAADGGWWALGLQRPADAHVLRFVPMSREDTGELTLFALRELGLRVAQLPVMSDVDTVADAAGVAAQIPASRFAHAFREAV